MNVSVVLSRSVLRMGIRDEFGQSGSPQELLRHYGLEVEDIVQKVQKLLEIKLK